MGSEIELVDQIWLCGANPEGHQRKREWYAQNLPLGLRSKLLRRTDNGEWAGSIEYMPGKTAWRAVEAKNYLVIHCLNVPKKYQGQGYGSFLIGICLEDARRSGLAGVVVLATRQTWCAGREVYLKNGFEVVDKAPPAFELLSRSLGDASLPSLGDWRGRLAKSSPGLTFFYSRQCPFMRAEGGYGRKAWLESVYGIQVEVVEIDDYLAAQANPCAWGTYGIVCNRKVINYVPGGNAALIKTLKRLKAIS